MKNSVKERALHVVIHDGFTEATRHHNSDIVATWREQVLCWEANPHKAYNPYLSTVRGKLVLPDIKMLLIELLAQTTKELRNQLAEEEAKTEAEIHIRHTMTPAEFVRQGLQLEDKQ